MIPFSKRIAYADHQARSIDCGIGHLDYFLSMVNQSAKVFLRVSALLLLIAGLLGADCRHCDLALGALASDSVVNAGCHQAAGNHISLSFDSDATLDCDCFEHGQTATLSATPATPSAPEWLSWAAIPETDFAWAAFDRKPVRPDWHPPPYPGFSENTIVLLN